MKKKLLGYLRVLFTPACWLQVYKQSKEWDKELNELLLIHKFEADPDGGSPHYTVKLGPKLIWVSNHPYASFSEWKSRTPFGSRRLPKRVTVLRAMDKLNKEIPEADRKDPFES